MIIEQRNWHTTASVSGEKENEKGPLHGEALACFSTSTCLHLNKRSPGHMPYLRASALIRNPSVFCAHTEQRKGGTGGVSSLQQRRQESKSPSPPNTAAQPHGLARHYSRALLSRRAAPLLLMALQTPDFNNADPELI